MVENRALTLIVAKPGPLRDAIEALLASVERVEVVGKTARVSTALRIAALHPLDLLLLEAGLPTSANRQLFQMCRRERPSLRSIVLADDGEQVREARSFGADAVFLKGFPADRFVRTVERLLPDRDSRVIH